MWLILFILFFYLIERLNYFDTNLKILFVCLNKITYSYNYKNTYIVIHIRIRVIIYFHKLKKCPYM